MKTNDEIGDFEAEYISQDLKSKKRKIILIAIIVLLILIIIVFFIIKLSKKKNDFDLAKEYDFFNFAFQNPRLYCYSYKKDIEYCLNKTTQYKNNKLTIHGLWPSIINKLVKEIKFYNCNAGTEIQVKIDDRDFYEKKMNKYWPSSLQNNTDFWTHEYNKHGYCYNQRNQISVYNYTHYFKKTVEIFEQKNISNLLTIISPEKSQDLVFKYNKTDFVNLVKNKTGATPYLFCVKYKDMNIVYEIQFALSLNFSYITNDNMVKEIDEVCPDSEIVFKFD